MTDTAAPAAAPLSLPDLADRMATELARLEIELNEVELLITQASTEAGGQRIEAGSGGRRVRRHQSSGIRIQPWRIAYTTAWVLSLTDSLRRIELMWFLTVCSLIVRA